VDTTVVKLLEASSMLYDVVLHVGEGPGFGHNTRMLAISQYALK